MVSSFYLKQGFPMIVDSHCHLDYDVFQDDFEGMLQNAHAHDVAYMMTIGVSLEKMPNVIAAAEKSPRIFATAGIHPHEADKLSDTEESHIYQTLLDYTKHPKIVGIGETGLDYFYEYSARDLQKKCFAIHIKVAGATGLPLIIHTRDADDDMISILQKTQTEKPYPFLIHCFSSTQRLADACLEMGGYVSISGIVTFKKAESLREIVKNLPLDRVLVETDSPYLAPIPHRGKRNEPAFTAFVAKECAMLMGVSLEELSRQTTQNYFNLFKKADKIQETLL